MCRFYFKCVNCWGEITFKTDPKNHDYVTESGCAAAAARDRSERCSCSPCQLMILLKVHS